MVLGEGEVGKNRTLIGRVNYNTFITWTRIPVYYLKPLDSSCFCLFEHDFM